MTRKSISIGWTSYHLTVILIVTLILFKQASQLPIDDDTDKRTGHNIMRFGRTTGHNILRFGRTPGHNIMRFGKREESNSAPGSSYEVSETKPLADLASRYSNLLDQLSEEGGPSSSGSSNLYDTSSSSASQGSSPLMYGYYGQPLPLNALFYNQRGQPVLPYQQAKKGRPETDHVIMRFG